MAMSAEQSLPCYTHEEKGLPLKGIIEICAGIISVDSSEICKSTPTPQKNAVFIVDTEAVKEKDLTCDDSGMYDSHSSPSSLVEIIMDSEKKIIKDVQLISRSKVPLDDPRLAEDNIFLVRRQYSTQNKKSGKFEDLQKELKKHPNLENTAVIKSILGNEINGKRELGLVDSKNFEEDYTKLSSQWPPEFKHYIESKQLKVRSLKETFKKNMGREVRIAAGLGNPPNKFDNQRAESMNSVLKESVGSRFLD
ncbi:uncharacterized protein LOC144619324 [Crassostrea virginica]